jgi:hypothetical protein
MQEITGKHAFKKALLNLKTRTTRPAGDEPIGTLVELLKDRFKTFQDFTMPKAKPNTSSMDIEKAAVRFKQVKDNYLAD